MYPFARTESKTSVPVELTGEGRFVLSRQEFVPAYLKTYEEGRLREKVEEALGLLGNCHVCPRNCEVNRLENKTGVCKSGRLARVASAFTHFGEEDCLGAGVARGRSFSRGAICGAFSVRTLKQARGAMASKSRRHSSLRSCCGFRRRAATT